MGFELDPSYKDVPTRIADFKEKHPEGCLRPVNPDEPYRIEAIDGRFFVIYMAAAYRTPDDPAPGIGVAWEPFPGRTPYTKDSELQNAETSAWGRAIVAALASESKAVASAEDVRNRTADAVAPVPILPDGYVWVTDAKNDILAKVGGDKGIAKKAWDAKVPEDWAFTVTIAGGQAVPATDAALAAAEAETLYEAAQAEDQPEQPELPAADEALHEARESGLDDVHKRPG